MAMIGCGWQGGSNMGGFLDDKKCQVVAVCDLRQGSSGGSGEHRQRSLQESGLQNLSRLSRVARATDIDAVMIATPDHWHALAAVEAARQGKDIYGEKPLGKTIAEQQAMVKAVQQNKRIWQTGSWQRSKSIFITPPRSCAMG